MISGFYDLQISNKIANPERLWGRILEIAGEPPALIFAAFNFSLLLEYTNRIVCKRKRFFLIICALSLIISAVYPIYKTFDYLDFSKSLNITLTIPITFAFCAFLIIIHRKTSDEYLKKYFKIALTCVEASLTVLIVISLLKQVWGRVRFRELDQALETGMKFTPWYSPQFFTGYRSFPSGHTGNATLIFLLSLYFPKQRKWLCPALIIWILLVAVSRVFVGAHYLSDVLFGCAITSIICYIWIQKNDVWEIDNNE